MMRLRHRRWASPLILAAAVLLVLLIAGAYFTVPWLRTRFSRTTRLLQYLQNPQEHPEWTLQAGDVCGQAPFQMPTTGFIGFQWGDAFRPGHRHQGVDIFSGRSSGETPVVAAYAGYLTRLPDWRSSVIIRIPADPLHPGRQIWTYYTHMASDRGSSYLSPDFPPGTTEKYIAAGTLLGYQGDYSGDPFNPVGVHLHFSIVLDQDGTFRNELEFRNTVDPSPYLGLPLNASQNPREIAVCKEVG
jgi:hypothetical protein